MNKKIVIIGGVAGGATAIARLRRLDENAEIVLLEKGDYVSFANCGLPYYIGQVIADRDALFVSTPEAIRAKYNVDIRVASEVTSIDKEKKTVTVQNHKTGESYALPYDALLVSTGSRPIKPPVEGFDGANVFTLWNIPDTDAIYNYIQSHKPKRATVIGGGFIGLEMAENLAERNMVVSVVEKADQVMAPLDKDMAQIVENHLREKGIKLITGNGVSKIAHEGKGSLVHLEDGGELETDLVILSIGIRPNSELLKEAGLALNSRGGVVVDEYLHTSDPNIYAVGDIIQVEDFVQKTEAMVPLAGPANKQGRIAADNIIKGNVEKYKGTQGTSVAKIFDLTVAATGANEKSLNREGKEYLKDYRISTIHVNSHAGYYPGAATMAIKLIFAMDGRVLGAQIVGYDGVDKRIDVIATAIRFGGKVQDLTELELAYAPPYSSAKDPVNMVGYTAVNQLEGLTQVARIEDLENLDKNEVVLDVREDDERLMGYIPNSISIPLGQLRDRLSELDKNKTYLVSCAVGLRGYIGERILKQNGFTAKNLMGGYRSYAIANPSDDFWEISADEVGDDGSVKHKGQDNNASSQANYSGDVIDLDVCGLCCPGPIVEVSKALDKIKVGDHVRVVSTDPGFYADIVAWGKSTGNTVLDRSSKGGKFFATIRKQEKQACPVDKTPAKNEKTMIVFDGDLDKAIAAFIIANGAAAMGAQVNMFFTFWGLNILRKNEKVSVPKDFMSKMFGMMMPRGSKKLGLSKMNMLGMGPKMIRMVMKKQNVFSLEELIQQAVQAGVKITACQMSMDVMGIKKQELIDGVQIGGVAAMLGDNDNSNMNLFI